MGGRDLSTKSRDEITKGMAKVKPVPKGRNGKPAAKEADAPEVAQPALPPLFGDLLPAALTRLARRRKGEEKPVPVPWPAMESRLGGGLWPGLNILVGKTGTGRSQLVLQMAVHAASAGVPTAYVSLELDELQLAARINSLAAGAQGEAAPWSYVYLGQEDAPKLTGAAWKEWPLHLLAAPPFGWHAEDLTALGAAMREEYPERTPGDRPFLLIVDFLQLVHGTDDGNGRTLDLRERIGRAAYAARTVATTFNAAVVLVSSTARDNYDFDTRGKRKLKEGEVPEGETFGSDNPSKYVGLGKESGEIEFAADGVFVLGQTIEGPVAPKPAEPVRMALGIAKARALSKTASGRWVGLDFDGTRFAETPPPKYQATSPLPTKAPHRPRPRPRSRKAKP